VSFWVCNRPKLRHAGFAGIKKPAATKARAGLSLALAEFIKRPQADFKSAQQALYDWVHFLSMILALRCRFTFATGLPKSLRAIGSASISD
jgi:hypothetical protein